MGTALNAPDSEFVSGVVCCAGPTERRSHRYVQYDPCNKQQPSILALLLGYPVNYRPRVARLLCTTLLSVYLSLSHSMCVLGLQNLCFAVACNASISRKLEIRDQH